MITHTNLFNFPKGTPAEVDFPDLVVGSQEKRTPEIFIGPKAVKDAGSIYVPLPNLEAVADGHGRLFMWGWAEYGDVFRKDQRSRSEFCFQVVVEGEPARAPSDEIKPPFDFVACEKHNGSEDECYRRPGDKIPIIRLP